MPSSSEMFGSGEAPLFKQPGIPGPGESMFKEAFGPPAGAAGPNEDEMRAAEDKIKNKREARVRDVGAEVFDLGDEKRRLAYRTLYARLLEGVRTSRVAINCLERKYVDDWKSPRWVVYVEWVEFDHIKKEREPVGKDGRKND